MKIVFLDFDGVLNNMSSLYLRTLNYHNNKPETFSVAAPNPVSVALISHLIRISGAKIVVSSSWRGGKTVEELRLCLCDEFGLHIAYRSKNDPNPVVIGKTRHTDKDDSRGQQIADWLSTHPDITHYVILDDDSDMLPEQQEHFVRTDIEVGFSGRDLNKCLEILDCKLPYRY